MYFLCLFDDLETALMVQLAMDMNSMSKSQVRIDGKETRVHTKHLVVVVIVTMLWLV